MSYITLVLFPPQARLPGSGIAFCFEVCLLSGIARTQRSAGGAKGEAYKTGRCFASGCGRQLRTGGRGRIALRSLGKMGFCSSLKGKKKKKGSSS